MSQTMQLISSIVVFVITLLSYFFIFKYSTKKLVLRRFHNAIKNAHKSYSSSHSFDEIIAQLYADYNGTIRIIGKVRFRSLYDLIEQICCRYNTYSDRDFEDVFREPKNEDIREFSCLLLKEIKKRNWYIELPSKESDLVFGVMQELDEKNADFGMAALKQLALNISDRENDRTRWKIKFWEIVNIIGILLSFAVSIISLVQTIIAK